MDSHTPTSRPQNIRPNLVLPNTSSLFHSPSLAPPECHTLIIPFITTCLLHGSLFHSADTKPSQRLNSGKEEGKTRKRGRGSSSGTQQLILIVAGKHAWSFSHGTVLTNSNSVAVTIRIEP